MNEISTNSIGLTAFALINGHTLIEAGQTYKINGLCTKTELLVNYTNSVCSVRDNYVRQLLSYWQEDPFVPEETPTFWTKKLGFAAFLLIKGVKLVGFADKKYWFVSDKQMNEWQDLYSNSLCEVHDNKVNELRNTRPKEI